MGRVRFLDKRGWRMMVDVTETFSYGPKACHTKRVRCYQSMHSLARSIAPNVVYLAPRHAAKLRTTRARTYHNTYDVQDLSRCRNSGPRTGLVTVNMQFYRGKEALRHFNAFVALLGDPKAGRPYCNQCDRPHRHLLHIVESASRPSYLPHPNARRRYCVELPAIGELSLFCLAVFGENRNR